MKRTKSFLLLLVFCLLVLNQNLQAQDDILEKLSEIAIIDQKVMMPMRDGVRLATDIYRPKTDEKVPIIFSRTPYNFNSWGDGKSELAQLNGPMKPLKEVMPM
jgi:predicted acyl esterase